MTTTTRCCCCDRPTPPKRSPIHRIKHGNLAPTDAACPWGRSHCLPVRNDIFDTDRETHFHYCYSAHPRLDRLADRRCRRGRRVALTRFGTFRVATKDWHSAVAPSRLFPLHPSTRHVPPYCPWTPVEDSFGARWPNARVLRRSGRKKKKTRYFHRHCEDRVLSKILDSVESVERDSGSGWDARSIPFAPHRRWHHRRLRHHHR
mmetsp:Transcript_11476/g.21954  ORF Transcript_11476/g.21954 Transcript_11476/m.21954 type:complete len:204 (-) Transcript_11476:894-1505(-)